MSMNINPKQLEALLNLAGKKLGTSPEQLKSQLENGNLQNAVDNLPPHQSAMLRQALADPKVAEKVLSSPQAQEIMKKLSK